MNKKILIAFMFCCIISKYSYGQQTISDLISNDIPDTINFEALYDLDVFQFYELYTYDTDLKKQMFKKSLEYQKYLSNLKTKREVIIKSICYTVQHDVFSTINYDIQRKGFDIEIGTNYGMGTADVRTPKSISINGGYIILKSLPTKQVPSTILGAGITSERLFLQTSEENGLEIENNKEDIDIYYFFTPITKVKNVFRYYNNSGSRFDGWYNITTNCLASNYVRVVIVNKRSGKILFDKTYSSSPIAPQK